jgi:hypothetical protein
LSDMWLLCRGWQQRQGETEYSERAYGVIHAFS